MTGAFGIGYDVDLKRGKERNRISIGKDCKEHSRIPGKDFLTCEKLTYVGERF